MDIQELHSRADGTLFGAVEVTPGRYVLFIGEELIEEIGGKKIEYVRRLYSQADNTVVGVVRLKDGTECLFKRDPFGGEELITKIGAWEIESVDELYPLSDGTLVGVLRIEGDRRVPFRFVSSTKNVLLEHIILDSDVVKIINIRDFRYNRDDGTIEGYAQLANGSWIKFKWDKVGRVTIEERWEEQL